MIEGVTLAGLAVLVTVLSGGLIGLALSVVAWRNRDAVPGARAYAGVVAAAGVWCLAYLGSVASATLVGAGLAGDAFDPMVTVFAMATPFMWFLFTLAYTGHQEWLDRPVVRAVFVEPVVYYAVYLTNPVHGWLFEGYETFTWQGLTLLSPRLTDVVLLQIGFMYLVTVAGAGLLVAFIMRTRNVHRRQAIAILVGALLTTAGNVIFVAGFSPHPALDVTPVFFVANGVVVAWALFRYDFLAVAPVGRDVLVEAMDDPVVVLGEDDELVDYNPAAVERLGVGDDDLGRSVEAALHGLVAALDAEGAVALETVDGEEAVFDPRPTTLTDQQGVTRGRLVVLREVTLLKRREQTLAALQSATRELMQAERRERVVAILVATAADVLDHEFAGFLSYDDEREVLEPTTLTPPVSRQVSGGEMRYAPDDGMVWDVFQSGEMVVAEELETSEDAPYWGDLPLSSAILLPLGEHGLLGVGSAEPREYAEDDVRFLRILAQAAESALDRQARERQVREHRDALEERNERLENFASIVSHDLRTPLTTATGYLALARQEFDDEDGYLERVADSHERMDSLIEDLLALARQGQVVDDPEPVPIEEVALNAWQTAGHVDATFDVASFPGDLVADRERVRTLLENLLKNAIEHVGTDVTVRVGPLDAPASADGGSGTADRGSDPGDANGDGPDDRTAADDLAPGDVTGFYVEDTGPGIPPEERDEVLEQGYSGDTGTGLGLAIVDRITDAHGWTVEIGESEEGGARFEFTGVELST
jgi:signal transduction histidine kinase